MNELQPRDLIQRFGERELLQLLGGEVLDEQHPRLQTACADAMALANSYLQRAYVLPLTHMPAVLVAICADIARFRLHHDQIREGGEQGKSALRLRYEEALQFLENVASGKLCLFNSSQSTAPTAPLPLHRHHRVAVVASPTVYTQATLDKMDGTK